MRTDFSLADWVVRPQRCCIERDDAVIHIKPKSMAVLECLAGADGNVVSRNQLFDSVWPGGIVSDDVLTQSVVELRKAFGDSAHNAQIIETIPKMGFRLVPPVLPLEVEVGSTAKPGMTGAAIPSLAQVDGSSSLWPSANIALPVIGLLLFTLAVFWYQTQSEDRRPIITIEDSKSLAVLPFVDLSPDQDQKYFADGLAEELLNGLARLKGLQVIGRTSSFSFKGKSEDIQTIGKILNVGHILEGSVRSSGNQLRITAQLVDASNGLQIWSEQYNRQLADIFAIQDDIAASVATALSIKLGVGDLGGIPGGTSNVEAYNEVLLGQSLYRKFTRDSVLSAIDHFKQAVELDPDYALAWERLADVYTTAGFVAPAELAQRWRQLSGEALDRALSLAPDSEVILATVAFRQVHMMQWQDAHRSLNLGPGLDATTQANTLTAYSSLFFMVGRARETLEPIKRLRRLDPLSGIAAWYAGHAYTETGRFEEGLAELERGFMLGNYLSEISNFGITAALASGDSAMLQKWLNRSIEHNSQTRRMNQAMSDLSGDNKAALKWLHQEYGTNPPGDDHLQVIWAAHHGDSELALNIMRVQPEGTWSFWSPVTTEVRKLPGFKDLVRDRGLVDYWREFGWGEYCQPLGADDFECQ